MRVWLGERWFTVIGTLDPVTLDPSRESAAPIGFDAAERPSAIASVPDGMACAVLVGVNSGYRLYASMAGAIGGGLSGRGNR